MARCRSISASILSLTHSALSSFLSFPFPGYMATIQEVPGARLFVINNAAEDAIYLSSSSSFSPHVPPCTYHALVRRGEEGFCAKGLIRRRKSRALLRPLPSSPPVEPRVHRGRTFKRKPHSDCGDSAVVGKEDGTRKEQERRQNKRKTILLLRLSLSLSLLFYSFPVPSLLRPRGGAC